MIKAVGHLATVTTIICVIIGNAFDIEQFIGFAIVFAGPTAAIAYGLLLLKAAPRLIGKAVRYSVAEFKEGNKNVD